MNVIKSIDARYKNRIIKSFDHSKYGKKLKHFKNLHVGKRCFLIGNGPSLKATDLTMIHDNGDLSFAFNRIYNMFEETVWRPTYYVSQDQKMLAGSTKQVNELIDCVKFIPIEFEWYDGIHVKNATFFHIKNKDESGYPAFSEDISKCIYNSKTVVYSAIQIAVYMGIKEIYLIGVDHHFHTSINNKGEIVIDPTAKDYFTDKYNEDKADLYIPNTDLSTLTYMAAKKYADYNGINIFNATRGGKLEVFPRVGFDTLFNNRIESI